MRAINFTCYSRPEPQGSSKAFVIAGRARITSTNEKLKPYRSEVTRVAIAEMAERNLALPLAPKHVPVKLTLRFFFRKPESVSKKRTSMVVKPDCDKLIRATTDALTGVLYNDDAQVVEYAVQKSYGSPERVEIALEVMA